MRLRILLTGTLIVLAVFGCDLNEALTPSDEDMLTRPAEKSLIPGDTVEIACGDTLFDKNEKFWISFDSLVSDSRCPIGVWCFWAGNAEVLFIFWANETQTSFSLNTYLSPAGTTVSGYGISLVDVYPYPHIDSLYSVDAYSAEIAITKP